MPLNERQRRFVEAYLVEPNATAAYRKAGYKAKGKAAETGAARLLRNAKVAAAVAAGQKKRQDESEVDGAWVLKRLTSEATRRKNPASARVAALSLIIKMQGLAAPDRHEHSGTIGQVHIYIPHNGRDALPPAD